MRNRYILWVLAVTAILSSILPPVAAACEDCFFNAQNIATCRPVFDGETGVTSCQSIATDCILSGTFCTEITAGGGGGGTGGGSGGGGSCHTSGGGGCPAECFSCSGGGRPRI